MWEGGKSEGVLCAAPSIPRSVHGRSLTMLTVAAAADREEQRQACGRSPADRCTGPILCRMGSSRRSTLICLSVGPSLSVGEGGPRVGGGWKGGRKSVANISYFSIRRPQRAAGPDRLAVRTQNPNMGSVADGTARSKVPENSSKKKCGAARQCPTRQFALTQ